MQAGRIIVTNKRRIQGKNNESKEYGKRTDVIKSNNGDFFCKCMKLKKVAAWVLDLLKAVLVQ